MKPKHLLLTTTLLLLANCLLPALVSAQKLWGMTANGGATNYGVIFQFNVANSACTDEHDFASIPNPWGPWGSLIQASDGNLYGMTPYGGAHGAGALFKYNPSDFTFTDIYDFDYGVKGLEPFGTLMQASDGNLYGMTWGGGANGDGNLFKFNPVDSTYTDLFDFAGTNGQYPEGSLIQASNGNLYGMTSNGGANNVGVIFKFNLLDSTYTDLFDFDGAPNGSGNVPNGSLMQASDGNLYGMTAFGGANRDGVIFQFNLLDSTYTDEFDFAGTNGKGPIGSLIQASDRNLYGTAGGGANGDGVLFQFNITNFTYAKMFDFAGASNGQGPNGSLMQASDGNLYGTAEGGVNSDGVLFQFNLLDSTYTKMLDFNGANGQAPAPYSNLIEVNVSTLPIELLNFNAVYNGKIVNLDWSTASEINNDFFTIERTKDGTNFTPVVEVKGAGTSNSLLNYHAVDDNPLSGVSYYRLKQTDYDGNYKYSKMVAVNVQSNSTLQIVALNPAGTRQVENSVQYFVSTSSGKHFNIEITDMIGKIILSTISTENNGTIDFSGFAHGIYLFRVSDNYESSVRKFVY